MAMAMERLKNAFSRDPCQKYYNLTRTLGQGSFATVKLATCKQQNTKWAVKIIKKSSLSKEDEEALESEVDILRKIDHPNIVKLREVFDCNNNFYMVMELCTGGELFDRIVLKEHYTEKEARECLTSIVSAVKYCHDHDIVHRDLKPENLLYSDFDDEKAVVKLADFGLAQLLNSNSLMTSACGTPGYVAPEILEAKPYGKEVDMWSVGVIAYILLCGFPPFYDESNSKLFKAIKSGVYQYPSPFWDEVSSEAKDLVDHLLVLDTSARFTADQALNHPWMKGEGLNSGNLQHFQSSLKAYNARRKFKATILTVQMMNRLGRATAPPQEPQQQQQQQPEAGA
jgi:calcium/calmodulin-dependent protein kinase I